MILRALLAALGLAAFVGALALGRPERFAVTFPCGLAIVIVAAGTIAADAFPLRRRALVCSILTLVCGVALLTRSLEELPAAGVVALQAAAVTWRRPAPAPPTAEV